MSTSKRFDWLINLCLLLGTVILFIGAIEVALRVTGLQTVKPNPPKIYQVSENSQISYELKPNIKERAYRSTVSTNSMGLRGGEVDTSKPVIPVIGDSITFGYGLEDSQTIPAVLDGLLPDISVVNAGTSGYNLSQQSALYADKIATLDPTAIVLIFHFNDLEESGTAWLDDQGIIRAEGWQPSESDCQPIISGPLQYLPAQCWLDEHSAFYKAVKKVIVSRGSKASLEETRSASRSNLFTEEVTDDQLAKYAKDLDVFVANLSPNTPRLFVIWPERRVHFVARPQLHALVERRGFRVMDMYEIFGNNAETLGWDTVHPNAKTANEAANVIKAALEYYGMLDSDS